MLRPKGNIRALDPKGNISRMVLTEKIIGKNGIVRLVDLLPRVVSGSSLKCDYAIAEAARVSYYPVSQMNNHENNKPKRTDAELIKYLFRNNHTSPFEMVEFKFYIKAPLFVIRQWQRHRMSSYNEISGRYSVLTDSFWEPREFRTQSKINKQGSESPLDEPKNWHLLQEYNNHIKSTYSFYQYLLSNGVSKEMARSVLPLSTMSEFYWKIDLHNLLRFISLRSTSHAQPEIREYSDSIKEIVKEYCPITMEAFEEYSNQSVRFSKTEIEAIKTGNHELITSRSGLVEFKEKLKLLNLKE